jgi:hypothetical protein
LRLTVLREQLGTSQPNVSQLERSEDLQLSSIAKYVHALGGQLQINAVVGDTVYRLMDDVDDEEMVKPRLDIAVGTKVGTNPPRETSASS